MKALTIGQVAKEAGVGIETIRFYEREGLIEPPPRRESGYRQFPVSTVKRIRFIRHAKDLGFTLREIRELLALRVQPNRSCRDVRKKAEEKIVDIDNRIQALLKMRAALETLVTACRSNTGTGECPILDSLEGDPS